MTRPAASEEATEEASNVVDAGNISDAKKSLTSVGNYRVLDQLGKGNFAKVVQAVHTVLKSKVCHAHASL